MQPLRTGNQKSIKSEEVGNPIKQKIRKTKKSEKGEEKKVGNKKKQEEKQKITKSRKSAKVGNWKMQDIGITQKLKKKSKKSEKVGNQ